MPAPVYEPRWTMWGGAYGGSNRTTGDVAVVGSHDLSARTVGLAGGFDYRLTPDTVVGLAFAGGGTNWSLSQGLGGGKGDAFQAGIYTARPNTARLISPQVKVRDAGDNTCSSDHWAGFEPGSYWVGSNAAVGSMIGLPYFSCHSALLKTCGSSTT